MSLACIASIDQGTSSSRVMIFSAAGKVLGSCQIEHNQHYPIAGQVEHDPLELWKNVKLCLSRALGSIKVDVEVVGIGITNQRETTIVWDKETGEPYHRAIVWNDTRTNHICEKLIEKFGSKDYFRQKTGLPIASYFSASKLLYLLETLPELRADAEAGKVLFGTVDTWLIWRLTNGKIHATDVTNASRTMLMNLETLDWDEEILQELHIPKQLLPNIFPSAHMFGHVDTMKKEELIEQQINENNEYDLTHFERYHNVAISGVLGDQNAALFGQTCFHKGNAKCTYGTGAFLLMNTGNDIIPSKHGLLTTLAYQLSPQIHGYDGKPVYALEGSVAYSGSLIQWLRDNIHMITKASETESIADSVSDNGGVYFVPAFAGLYAPYWREDARAIICGLTAYNTKAHIVRAALEASAFQVAEVTRAMAEDMRDYNATSTLPEDEGSNHNNNNTNANNNNNHHHHHHHHSSVPKLTTLKVDGGFSANSLIMQFQSDILQVTLARPKIAETTCLGAAFVAGLGTGIWKSLSDIEALWHQEKSWHPHMPLQQRGKLVSLVSTIFTIKSLFFVSIYIYICIYA
jgi:glycerol kinase